MEGFGKRTDAACGQADLDSKCNISLVFIDIYRGFVAVGLDHGAVASSRDRLTYRPLMYANDFRKSIEIGRTGPPKESCDCVLAAPASDYPRAREVCCI